MSESSDSTQLDPASLDKHIDLLDDTRALLISWVRSPSIDQLWEEEERSLSISLKLLSQQTVNSDRFENRIHLCSEMSKQSVNMMMSIYRSGKEGNLWNFERLTDWMTLDAAAHQYIAYRSSTESFQKCF